MLRYNEIPKHPNELRDLTSLMVPEFELLMIPFEQEYVEYMSTTTMLSKPRRSRSHAGYKNCPLPTSESRLLFILVYLKNNTTQTLHGKLFGMKQSVANRWIHLLFPVLRNTLRRLGDAPCRTLAELGRKLAADPSPLPPGGLSVATAAGDRALPSPPLYSHDATERAIQPPTNPDVQKTHYSGKKKRHTIKNLLLISALCLIVFLSPTLAGSIHDKKIADLAPYPLPPGSHLLQDLGFQGFALADVHILQPTKKPRGKDLTTAQKEVNRQLAQRRVRNEHVNSSVKRCRMLKDTIRMRKQGIHDLVMEVGSALHNFRLRVTSSWKALT